MPFQTYLLSYAEELDRRIDGKGRVFAVETLDGKHIGNCCYYNVEWDRREAEVGIMIGDPAYWDAGYGTDAVKALVDHTFLRKRTLEEGLPPHTGVERHGPRNASRSAASSEDRRVTRAGYDFIHMEMKRPDKLHGAARSGTVSTRLKRVGHQGLVLTGAPCGSDDVLQSACQALGQHQDGQDRRQAGRLREHAGIAAVEVLDLGLQIGVQ